jgi:hypothetical protein
MTSLIKPPPIISSIKFCNNPTTNLDKFKKEIIIRSIKIIDMTYATFLYAVVSLVVVIVLDKNVYKNITFDKTKKDEEKSIYLLFAEVLFLISLNSIIAYILRNLLQMIPFPLNNVCGFDHMRVMEVRSGGVIATILLWFCKTIRMKIMALQSKF